MATRVLIHHQRIMRDVSSAARERDQINSFARVTLGDDDDVGI